jgi:hypothetical protein
MNPERTDATPESTFRKSYICFLPVADATRRATTENERNNRAATLRRCNIALHQWITVKASATIWLQLSSHNDGKLQENN